MRGLKITTVTMMGAALLGGCLEPQPAPEISSVSSDAFKIEVIATALKNPWSVSELPDETFLVTEKGGQLFHYKPWGRQLLTGLPDDIFVSGQGGLLDVVPATDVMDSGEIYISYAYGDADNNGTALIRAKLPEETKAPADLRDVTVIFRASPPKAAASHFGGKIAFLPDETLVLTLGDGFAYREDAQKADTHLGKLVRLTRSGHPAPENPFIGRDDGNSNLYLGEIYSLGHRNPQGLAYDAQTNTLWEHEHGPRGGDELNRIEPGANYGWPLATTGRDYQGARISPYETFEGMVDPIHDWVPSIAPSGLAIYRGDMFPEWNGDALIGGLASRDLRRVDLENGKSVGEESLLADLEGRVRDVRITNDGGVLILIEDPENGRILKLLPKG